MKKQGFKVITIKKTKYRIGDLFSVPKPGVYKLRIREVEFLDYWDGPQYALQLFTFQTGKIDFCWLNRDHDYHFTDDQIDRVGLKLIEKGPEPAPIQMELF